MLPSLWSVSNGGTHLRLPGTTARSSRRVSSLHRVSSASLRPQRLACSQISRSYASAQGATVEGTQRFFSPERQAKRLELLQSRHLPPSPVPAAAPEAESSTANPSYHSPLIKPKVNKKTGWTLGPIGLGTMRMNLQSMEHQEAMELALQTGATNVIDTSPNYGTDAEALVGMTLQRLIEADRVSRDEIIIVEKIGPLVSGSTLEPVKQRAAKGRPFQNMTLLSPELGYCLDPDYLDFQITKSLKSLELDTIDLLLIDTPEVVLPEQPSEIVLAQLYRMLQNAMGYLEQEVKRGRIQYYGVSSAVWGAVHRQDNPKLSFDMVYRTAHTLGEANHFAAIAYPLNMFEPQYAHNDLTASQVTCPQLWSKQGRDSSLQLQAFQAGLIQLSTRPLNGLIPTEDIFTHIPKPANSLDPNGLMYRLASVPNHDGAKLAPIVKATINGCVALEKSYALEFEKYKEFSKWGTAAKNVAINGPMPPTSEFAWTQICLANLSRLDLETFKASWQLQMQPAIKASCAQLRKARPEMDIWATAYERGMESFAEQYQQVLETNKAQELSEFMAFITKGCPSLDNPTISSRAVRVATSTLVTTALVGMRTPAYVKDITYGGGSNLNPHSMLPIDPSFLGNIFDSGSVHSENIRKSIRAQLALEEEAVVQKRTEEAEERAMAVPGPARPNIGGAPKE